MIHLLSAMAFRFGKEETVTCIVDVDVRVGDGAGEPACLAYKTTTHWIGGGAWLTDDGYVLKPKGSHDKYYTLPPGAGEGTVEGLPHPFPPYSIPFSEYVFGYSLWLAIAVTIFWFMGVKVWRKRKQRGLAARLENAPLDRGPPRLDTAGDRFVYETVKALLRPGESIQHQAYASSWDYNNDRAGDAVYFVVLTTQRLVVITTRKGAFGILYENERVDGIERHAIDGIAIEHGNVLFVTAGGVQRGFIVKSARGLSNQDAFLLNVSRLLSGPA